MACGPPAPSLPLNGWAATVLELDTIRDSSNAQPAVVQAVVRVYDNSRSLQSVIRGPAIAVDLKQLDRKAAIDELLADLPPGSTCCCDIADGLP